jgi:beta-lactamase class D
VSGHLIALTIITALSVAAFERAGFAQESAHTCIVIREARSGTVWRSDPTLCATRLSPASTFKIPHALVALETGVVGPDTVEKWDGTRHPDLPKWDRDHSVTSAMRPSVLWFFQRMAPRVGAARMHHWLEQMRYGNARTDGDVTMYWVNGTLQISPEEQVSFLQQFYADRLPIGREWQGLVRGALDQPPGMIENSRGVSRLEGTWPAGATWNAKTGRAGYAGRSVSWLVGELSVDRDAYVFAAAVWRDGGPVGFLDGAHAAVTAFIERGLLKPSPR